VNPKYIPEILPTRKFKDRFFECFQRHPTLLRISSPYIGELPNFKDIVNFSRFFLREEGVNFQLITSPPVEQKDGRYLSKFNAEILVNLGVDLVIRKNPYLHSKVYQFTFPQKDKVAFVGSANFTKGGLERNDETVAMFRDPEVNKKVEAELDRLSSFGSQSYVKWKYNNALEEGAKNV